MKSLFLAIFLAATGACSAQTQASNTAAPVPDERGNFEAAAYTGVVIDNFAAQESNALIYPGSGVGVKSSYIVGIDFAYRLVGNAADVRAFKGSQLWVYGEPWSCRFLQASA